MIIFVYPLSCHINSQSEAPNTLKKNSDFSRIVYISDSFIIPLNGKIGAHRERCHLVITDLFSFFFTENREVDTQSCMILPEKNIHV